MSLNWKLKDVLNRNKITVYRLADASGVPRNTLYNLVNKSPARVDLGTLDAVLDALDGLTGMRLTVGDLLERGNDSRDPKMTAAGVPYTGDPETDWWLNNQPDILERVQKLESGENKLIPIEDVATELGLSLER